MRFIYVLILLLVCSVAYAVPTPTAVRPSSYTTGSTVDADNQNSNEDKIYTQFNAHDHQDFTKTTSTTLTIGANADSDHEFIVDNGDTNNPRLHYDSGDNKWQYANDGVTFNNMITSTDVGTPRGSISGLEIASHQNLNFVRIGAGAVEIGTSIFTLTPSTDQNNEISLASNSTWIGGTADDTQGIIYVYALEEAVSGGSGIATFNFSKTAPDATDVNGTALWGVKRFYSTGGVDYRVIGAVLNNSEASVEPFLQRGDWILFDEVEANTELRVLNGGNSATYADVDCSSLVPTIAREVRIHASSTGTDATCPVRPNGTGGANGVYIDWGANARAQFVIGTDDDLVYEYKIAANATTHYIAGYRMEIR